MLPYVHVRAVAVARWSCLCHAIFVCVSLKGLAYIQWRRRNNADVGLHCLPFPCGMLCVSYHPIDR